MDLQERQAIRASCTRALSRHPPARGTPAAILARLAALATPELESDAYGEGEVVAALEREVAGMLGKEAAVFMPSGTMAQVIALRIWSDRRRCTTVAFHPRSHLELHEERAYQRLHGLHARLVGEPTRLMTLADLDRIAEPISALLVELPQRELGGLLPEWADLGGLAAWAKGRGVALHLDGARLWESQPFYGRPLSEIAALFDSAYVSVYKTLNGLAGCLLAGPAEFIGEARVWQHRQGGRLPAVWPYVLSARAGLADHLPRIPLYVAKAQTLAPRLAAIPGIDVVPAQPPTNMFHLHLHGDRERLQAAMLEVARSSRVWLGGRLRGTDSPQRHLLEVSCGEAALELEDQEVAELFASVMARAEAD